MAYERNPNDPYRANLTDDDVRRQAHRENELPPDPELAEGSAGGASVAMFAVAIAIILGAIFYGLNNTSTKQGGTSSTAQNSPQTSSPATPRANTDPGMTTGTAPAQPQPPRSTAPAEMNRPGNPPADNAPASK
jgi:uncharacterized protein HemX